jgi:hypothetical protein
MAAAILAAAFLLVWTRLPPSHTNLPQATWQQAPTVTGAFHIHTNRSDGSGSPDDVAAAAARAGLRFIIFTDHGDATRVPDAPQYRSGVLCLDAVEISTTDGHYIAVGLPQSPYPLAGEGRDVVEDVHRLGGFGIVAHPDSAKPGLRWYEWTAPVDGIEWLNADSEWRDETRQRLRRSLLDYPLRPAETLAALLDRSDQTFARWDALAQRRRVVGVAGADAHARVGRQENEASGYRSGWFVRIPSYDVSFRTFAMRVTLARPLSGDAQADAAQLIDAIAAGHLYSAIDAVATPAALDFSATNASGSAGEGDRLMSGGGAVTFTARVNAPTGGTVVLRKDGQLLTQHPVPELKFQSDGSDGEYRVEVYLANSPGQPPVPWIVSNPIYVRPANWGQPYVAPISEAMDRWPIHGPWHVEKDTDSAAEVKAPSTTGPVSFDYRLAHGPKRGQYAALVLSTGNALRGHERFAFRGRANHPMRISLQARRPNGGDRWQRSIYLDSVERVIVVPFTDMKPVGATSTFKFDALQIDTVLFVADTTNALPGSEGTFSISELYVEH